jgi:phospholipid/cholesterol/gamma-HCH transport system ATP-binding protein
VVVTYNVSESLKVVDHAFFIFDGKIVAEGSTADILASDNPFVRQFVDGQADGPVAFHMPAKPLAEEFSIS